MLLGMWFYFVLPSFAWLSPGKMRQTTTIIMPLQGSQPIGARKGPPIIPNIRKIRPLYMCSL